MQVLGGPLIAVLLIALGTFLARRLTLPHWVETFRAPLSVLFLCSYLAVAWICYHYAITILFRVGNELIKLAVPGFLVIGITLKVCNRKQAESLERLVAVLAAAGVLFGLFFGQNWGYPGRMILSCAPFLLLAIVKIVEWRVPSEHWRRTALVACILFQAIVFVPAVRSAWRVGDPVPLSLVEKTGRAADAIRQLAGVDSLSIFVPDVGGTSLYFARLEILDSALLANSFLAHHGYQATEQYLEAHRPQVIESHGIWSIVTKVYQGEAIKGYSPVVVDGTRLLLRNDIHTRVSSELDNTTGADLTFGVDCLADAVPIDFLGSRQSCLFISHDDLVRNGVDLK